MHTAVTPEQIARLIKSTTGMTLADLYTDGDMDNGQFSDRLKQVYLSGPCILVDPTNADLDDPTHWLLITTPEMGIEGDEFWREALTLLDTVDPTPSVPNISGDWTFNQYREAIRESISG